MPPSPSAQSKASSDDSSSRLSEAALRKKKNADAQAAFRARRANYIATLEETVTNLESVVIQLQDSYRQTKNENVELRQENAHLRQAIKQRDRVLKRVQQNRPMAANLNSPSDDFPPVSPYAAHPVVTGALASAHVDHYTDNTMRYATGHDPSVSIAGAFYHSGNGQEYQQRSPAMSFTNNIGSDASSVDPRAEQMDSHRITRYDQYPYTMDNSHRDGTWAADEQSGRPSNDMLDSSSSSHSPNYAESPISTASELAYPAHYVEEQKGNLSTVNSYSMYPASRSISPAVSTPTSTSSSSLAPSPFPFTFPEAPIMPERPEFGYRRPNAAPQLTLHGGTADISVALTGRDNRYRMAPRSNILTDRPIAQALSSYTSFENNSGGRDSDDGESPSYTYTTRSHPRSETVSSRASRSPSPAAAPICGTLAVIKAQAFGALRRTRTRSRKTSESAAKAAVEALEARGIDMGLNTGTSLKRPRLLVDDDSQS